MTVMFGGFGLCGIPINFIRILAKYPDKNNFIVISNDIAIPNEGLDLLLTIKQIKKMIASYVGENKVFE